MVKAYKFNNKWYLNDSHQNYDSWKTGNRKLEFNVPCQTNTTISETKRSEVESYPYPVKEGHQYINLNPGRLFVQQPSKKEKGSRGSFTLLR